MEAVIFDLDGVLVDSMPTHVKAWQDAFKKIAGIYVSDREIYLLEGMRGMELIAKIIEQKGGDESRSKEIQEEKNRIFRSSRRSEPFEGAAEILESVSCPKAVVSGSAKADVQTILDEAFENPNFTAIITADDVKVGKPDPTAFLEASRRMGVSPDATLVVENAPLGAAAAERAGMQCYVVLNNTPLSKDDFKGKVDDQKIFKTTGSLSEILEGMCK